MHQDNVQVNRHPLLLSTSPPSLGLRLGTGQKQPQQLADDLASSPHMLL